jgi:hypothetical protein
VVKRRRRGVMQVSDNIEPKWWRKYNWKRSILRWTLGTIVPIIPVIIIGEVALIIFFALPMLAEIVFDADWDMNVVKDVSEWNWRHLGPSLK